MAEVPAVAPDTVPPGWLDDVNLTSDSRALYKFVKDVVTVLFRPGTSQGQRTDAIASVSGQVVGGMRIDGADGLYYVRLPADPTNDSVFAAIESLIGHPAVRAASLKFVLFDAVSSLKPGDDATRWHRADGDYPEHHSPRATAVNE